MRQFTMNIEDGLLLAAKRHALSTGRSVSDIVRDLLAREVGWRERKNAKPIGEREITSVLSRYSNGEITRRSAMDELDLDPSRYPEFVDLMERHSMPWPKVDREQIEREADIVAELIMDSADAD